MSYPKIIGARPHHNTLLMRKSPIVVIGKCFIKFSPIFITIFLLKIGIDYGFIKAFLSSENLRFAYRLACLMMIAESVRQYYNSSYVLATKRLIQIDGYLSLSYLRSSIAYRDIRDVQLDQSILGRLLNHGTIRCGTAAMKEHEITFTDVFRAHYVKDFIENKITNAKLSMITLEKTLTETDMAQNENGEIISGSLVSTLEFNDSID